MRTCRLCGRTDKETPFYKSTFGRCKDCQNNVAKNNYYANRTTLLPKRNAYAVTYRKTHKAVVARGVRKWVAKNPEKDAAHKAVHNAIRKGLMIRPATCSACGVRKARLHGHHRDYSKPLDVEWLCPKCHSNVAKVPRPESTLDL